MRLAVLFDLFNTLVPGGRDSQRHAVSQAMGEALGVDPAAYAAAFHAAWPERFVGSLGDLPATVRAVAARFDATAFSSELGAPPTSARS